VFALERAGAGARGATAYLNLEPCAHHGRTPPCAPRLAAAGVRRVVASLRDPDPRVDGRGLALLRGVGVAVTTGVLAEEARRLNLRFLTAVAQRRPFILLKAALTLDGRIATAQGESKWLTSPVQRKEARRLRRLHDGVLVGIGTVLADDPRLLPEPRVTRPFHRVVLDTRLRLPLDSRLVRGARRAPVWVICRPVDARRRRQLEALGVNVIEAPPGRGRVPLTWALRALRARGVTSLMVEGGSQVLGAFLAARLFDQLALFRAPLLLGGVDSLPAFGGRGPARLAGALRLRPVRPLPPTAELWYPEG
jgi:diaminohydroxyphosphoribosylaminopyrimidine deaminase/5-amino-6-(5-phosphoribosylamino)uracil reductase